MYVVGLFKGSFGLFNAYLVVFGLFLPKTEEKIKIPLVNNFKDVLEKFKMWIESYEVVVYSQENYTCSGFIQVSSLSYDHVG